jgi:hypothetical protein
MLLHYCLICAAAAAAVDAVYARSLQAPPQAAAPVAAALVRVFELPLPPLPLLVVLLRRLHRPLCRQDCLALALPPPLLLLLWCCQALAPCLLKARAATDGAAASCIAAVAHPPPLPLLQAPLRVLAAALPLMIAAAAGGLPGLLQGHRCRSSGAAPTRRRPSWRRGRSRSLLTAACYVLLYTAHHRGLRQPATLLYMRAYALYSAADGASARRRRRRFLRTHTARRRRFCCARCHEDCIRRARANIYAIMVFISYKSRYKHPQKVVFPSAVPWSPHKKGLVVVPFYLRLICIAFVIFVCLYQYKDRCIITPCHSTQASLVTMLHHRTKLGQRQRRDGWACDGGSRPGNVIATRRRTRAAALEVQALGDLAAALHSAAAIVSAGTDALAAASGPLEPAVRVVGGDIAAVADLQPTLPGIARLSVRVVSGVFVCALRAVVLLPCPATTHSAPTCLYNPNTKHIGDIEALYTEKCCLGGHARLYCVEPATRSIQKHTHARARAHNNNNQHCTQQT